MSGDHNRALLVGHRLSAEKITTVNRSFEDNYDAPYVSDIRQKGEWVFLRFFIFLRRLSPLFCCSEEIAGRSTRRATSSVSLF